MSPPSERNQAFVSGLPKDNDLFPHTLQSLIFLQWSLNFKTPAFKDHLPY